MVDYKNGKIYKIVCNISQLVYIGSTCRTLSQRLSSHLSNYKKGKNITSKSVIEGNDYYIILLEDYPCENKKQLHNRERYFIENNECVNKYIPTRTLKEWVIEYREKNRTTINEKHREYVKKRNENDTIFNENTKKYMKNYREENKEKNKEKEKERKKKYYEANKETLMEKQREYRKAKQAKQEEEEK